MTVSKTQLVLAGLIFTILAKRYISASIDRVEARWPMGY